MLKIINTLNLSLQMKGGKNLKKKQRLRRRFMFFTYVFLCVAAILFLLLAKTAGQETEKAYLEHYVLTGDTLWKLAEEYAPNTNTLKWVYEVTELNGKETSELMAGEVIKVYVEKEDKQ